MNDIDIVRKLNKEYVEIAQSPKYRLGEDLFGILEAFKKFDIKALKYYWEQLIIGIKLQKYNSKVNRFVEKKDLEKIPRTAVYMALFGDYDEILEPAVVDTNCDYYIFTDQNIADTSLWKKISLSEKTLKEIERFSNVEKNRYFKMVGYSFFEKYEYSIYVDSGLAIYSDVSRFVKYCNTETGIGMFSHPARDCVFSELKACLYMKKVKKNVYNKLSKRMKTEGMPEHYGLCECGVIVRKTDSKTCEHIMKHWWNTFKNSSVKRDQILFPYVLWKQGIKIEQIGCLGEKIDQNGDFRRIIHKNDKR